MAASMVKYYLDLGDLTLDNLPPDASADCKKVLAQYGGTLPHSKLAMCAGNHAALLEEQRGDYMRKQCQNSCYAISKIYMAKDAKPLVTRETAPATEIESYANVGIELTLPVTRADFARFAMLGWPRQHDNMDQALLAKDPRLQEEGMEELTIALRGIESTPSTAKNSPIESDCSFLFGVGSGTDSTKLKKCEDDDVLARCPAACRGFFEDKISDWENAGYTPQELLDEARNKYEAIKLLEKEYRIEYHPIEGKAKLEGRIAQWGENCKQAKEDALADPKSRLNALDARLEWDPLDHPNFRNDAVDDLRQSQVAQQIQYLGDEDDRLSSGFWKFPDQRADA